MKLEAPSTCLLLDSTDAITRVRRDAEIQPLGRAYFYLVSYNDGLENGYGSYTASSRG